MKVWQFPLSRITLTFVFGILFSFYLNLNPKIIFFLIALIFVGFVFTFLLFKKELRSIFYFGIITYLLSFCIGISTQIIHNDYFQKDNYIHQVNASQENHLTKVVLREKLKSSTYHYRYFAIVKKIDHQNCSGKILLSFKKNKQTENFQIGSQLQINGTVIKHKPVTNPDQFDYGKYLEKKSVLAQMFVKNNEIKINTILEKSIWFYSDKIRNTILKNLKKTGFADTELSVIAALILGQQQDISTEILNDYQFAGAIHVLSVSGLHIGYLLLFMTFLLKPLPKNNWGSIIKLIVIFFSLWSFAILAGFSPSVVRSVTMFSFVAIGMHLKRRTNIFHTLLVSMLLILLFEPSFLFDVGFQLSYVSLFFILWLQPLLSGIWEPEKAITKYFWDIITVSFAAQIGALPLSIYYFHQFPGLFFLTNLIILPAIGIIMALGVFVMILAILNCIPLFLSKTLQLSIFYLNKIISWIASIENFIIKDIAFNWQLLLSSYLLIIVLFVWLMKPSFKKFALTLISFLIFQFTFLSTQWTNTHNKEWVVFDVKKTTLISERIGNEVSCFSKDSILPSKIIQPYLTANFCKLKTKKRIKNIAYFNSKKIMIIDSLGNYIKKKNPDVLLLRQSPKINLERLIADLKPKIIVADGSNFKTYLKLWKATCKKQNIPFHATNEMGYYRLE